MKSKLVKNLLMMLAVASIGGQAVSLQATEVYQKNEVGMQQMVEEEKNMEQRIKEKVQSLCDQFGITSIQYALVDGETFCLADQVGVYSRTENKPLTAEHMYGIGSVSKMYTATAVMMLVDEGKVDLDTPVTTYISEFQMMDERYKAITVRMLLNHSSGLMGSTSKNAFLFDDKDTYAHDELLENLKVQRLKADPGAFSVYCNDGFTLAEILVERVSEMDFSTFISEKISKPLGLTHTKTPQDEFDADALAKIYGMVMGEELPRETVGIIGTGGLYSTAKELCLFGQSFTNEGKLLSQEAKDAMAYAEYQRGISPEGETGYFAYGLGWDSVELYPLSQYGIKALNKGGDTLNYHSSLIVLPEYDKVAAVISSGGGSQVSQMIATEILLESLKEEGIIKAIQPEKTFDKAEQVAVDEAISQYAGIYSMGIAGTLEVKIQPEGLLTMENLMTKGMVPPQTFTHTGEGVFISEDGTGKVTFTKKNNHTYLEQTIYPSLPGLPQQAMAYMAQKLEAVEVDEEIMNVWAKRTQKIYCAVSEKYTSQAYLQQLPIAMVAMLPELPGYASGRQIVDENQAIAVEQIPGLMGRDLSDLIFTEKEGVEYLQIGGHVYQSGEMMEALTEGNVTCQLDEEGYASWYTVAPTLAGKTLQVEVPEKAGFMVYDAVGRCVFNTVVQKQTQVVLPEGGYVIFAGDPQSTFKITIQ
ncbi:MAG: serine hydrolase domain-containing protein [Cellulosilyticaceae bacterium]